MISGLELSMGAIPGLGEHTDVILGELGYSAEDIAGLRAEGAIGEVYGAGSDHA